ncbi:GPP34 family phosphoprotein [Streptomyces sp. AK04-4c]|uniref:GOLPH3/VPS74 family protein n=1 Tax=Streptomyces sp. AK04-4c TaxID=3028651 RepID=UPI0029BB0AA3|nr:GPP34 family phosphoprotein [Streptomyces sp. AK04-4c]MDX3688560.1 GPP34 family phosphoprotein [Streptomyces sp. AK04-4c]
MPATLAQKLYLLCYSVKKEKFQLDNIQGRGQLLRAGAMTELARGGLLDATGGKVRRLPGNPPEDPFTASVWYDLPEDKPKGWLKFLHNKAHTAETPVRDQLLASGDVAIERQKKLGVVPTNRVTVVHPDLVYALQDRVRANVLDGAPADELTDELAMAVLAVELELTSVWSKGGPPHPQVRPEGASGEVRRVRPRTAQGAARLLPREPGRGRRLERLNRTTTVTRNTPETLQLQHVTRSDR